MSFTAVVSGRVKLLKARNYLRVMKNPQSTLKCLEIVVAVEPNYGEQPYYLLHPNEYSFVTDILSCSYHPPECACNNTIINLSGKFIPKKVHSISNPLVDFYKLEWGRPGQQFP